MNAPIDADQAAPWVCPWDICTIDQAQVCRVDVRARRGCGGAFPEGTSPEAAKLQVAPRSQPVWSPMLPLGKAPSRTCKTCEHWKKPDERANVHASDLCDPVDPDTYKPMARTFETRMCMHPAKTFGEALVEPNGFGLVDASNYFAALCTGEDFGCLRHSPIATPERKPT